MTRNKRSSNANVKLLFAIIMFVIVGIVLYMQLAPYIKDFWPTKSLIKKKVQALNKERERLQQSVNELAKLEADGRSLVKSAREYWIDKRDGDRTTFQKTIENTAKKVGLEVSSISSIRENNVDEGISILEVSVTAKGKTKQVTDFIKEIYFCRPTFYWSNISMRPYNIKKPDTLAFSGRIQVMRLTNPDYINLVLGKN